eukprot:CAMPEP_0170625764 /NCGR_PEP_ID=MMETSP0224-20130122/30950_1 /TAXON_ID=285029 /ORGANISM="Togula jolla, Strain CCCM 725" /LENGTH=196 /DNA_ID=CAMNT_0010952395 /DNA_START=90 /DNA_END=677 /DNA_ORIENTATION=+
MICQGVHRALQGFNSVFGPVKDTDHGETADTQLLLLRLMSIDPAEFRHLVQRAEVMQTSPETLDARGIALKHGERSDADLVEANRLRRAAVREAKGVVAADVVIRTPRAPSPHLGLADFRTLLCKHCGLGGVHPGQVVIPEALLCGEQSSCGQQEEAPATRSHLGVKVEILDESSSGVKGISSSVLLDASNGAWSP